MSMVSLSAVLNSRLLPFCLSPLPMDSSVKTGGLSDFAALYLFLTLGRNCIEMKNRRNECAFDVFL